MFTLVVNNRTKNAQEFETMALVNAELLRRRALMPAYAPPLMWYVEKEVYDGATVPDPDGKANTFVTVPYNSGDAVFNEFAHPYRVVIAQSRNGKPRTFNTTLVLKSGMTRITVETAATPFGTFIGRWRVGDDGAWSAPDNDGNENRLGKRLVEQASGALKLMAADAAHDARSAESATVLA